MLNPTGNLSLSWPELTQFPENKFLVGVFKGYSNHPTMAAMLRSLTPWYFAQKFGLKWFMQFAQIFGTPMRIAEYVPGDQTTFNALCEMLEQMGSANWGVFPVGSKIELLETKASNGTMLPQRVLFQDADEQCDIMILGQTLTSSVRQSGGNRALGQVHADTERKVLNGVADFVRTVINRQLIPGILMLNYGNADECPTLEGTIEEPTDELALAQRDQILFSTMGLPVAKDYMYTRHSVPEPDDNAELFKPPMAGPDPAHGVPTMPAEQAIIGGVKGPKPQKPEKPKAKASMQMMLAARQGLALRKEFGHGGTVSAVTRARDIAKGTELTEGTAKRLMMYFDGHPQDATAALETPEGIAFLLHGGAAGKLWVEQLVNGENT
jgi:phage gp29-like protein